MENIEILMLEELDKLPSVVYSDILIYLRGAEYQQLLECKSSRIRPAAPIIIEWTYTNDSGRQSTLYIRSDEDKKNPVVIEYRTPAEPGRLKFQPAIFGPTVWSLTMKGIPMVFTVQRECKKCNKIESHTVTKDNDSQTQTYTCSVCKTTETVPATQL